MDGEKNGKIKADKNKQIRPKPSHEGCITTAMPGTIVDIKVNIGDKVNAGDGVVVIEAMKMENEMDYDFLPEKPKPLVIVKEDGSDEEILLKMGLNESNKIEFQMNMTEYTDKIKTYTENKIKAYSYI